MPRLQKQFLNIIFVFVWEFCIGKWRGFLVNFFWSPFPRNTARKFLKNFGENSGQKKNSGREFEKFGELSLCNFSDLSDFACYCDVGFEDKSIISRSPPSENPPIRFSPKKFPAEIDHAMLQAVPFMGVQVQGGKGSFCCIKKKKNKVRRAAKMK